MSARISWVPIALERKLTVAAGSVIQIPIPLSVQAAQMGLSQYRVLAWIRTSPLWISIRLVGAWLAGTRPKSPFTNTALLTSDVVSALRMKPPEVTNRLLTIFADPPDHATARPKSLRSNRTRSRTRFPLPSTTAVTPSSPSIAFGIVLSTIWVRVSVTFAPSAAEIAARLQLPLKSTISLADESVMLSDAFFSTLASVGRLWNVSPAMLTFTAVLSASNVPIWMNPNVCLMMSEFAFVGQTSGTLI